MADDDDDDDAAIPEAEALADALVAVLRHQIQLHVPSAWLQAQVLTDGGGACGIGIGGGIAGAGAAAADGIDGIGGIADSVEATMEAVEQRVRGCGAGKIEKEEEKKGEEKEEEEEEAIRRYLRVSTTAACCCFLAKCFLHRPP
jgi:hypothetical protein